MLKPIYEPPTKHSRRGHLILDVARCELHIYDPVTGIDVQLPYPLDPDLVPERAAWGRILLELRLQDPVWYSTMERLS